MQWVGAACRRRSAAIAIALAIGGDSAGANLAAVCAILARDAGAPALRFQLLVYPRTAPDEEFPSHHEFAEGYLLTRKTILWFHDHYRASDADRDDFRYAPLICPDLSRLPPALDHRRRMRSAARRRHRVRASASRERATQVELADYPGMVHPFFSMGGAVDAGRAAMEEADRGAAARVCVTHLSGQRLDLITPHATRAPELPAGCVL